MRTIVNLLPVGTIVVLEKNGETIGNFYVTQKLKRSKECPSGDVVSIVPGENAIKLSLL